MARTVPSDRQIEAVDGEVGVYREKAKTGQDSWDYVNGTTILSAFRDGDIVILESSPMERLVVYNASALRFYDVSLGDSGGDSGGGDSGGGGHIDHKSDIQWVLISLEETSEDVESEDASGADGDGLSLVRRYKIYSCEVHAGFLTEALARALSFSDALSSGLVPVAVTLGEIQNSTKKVLRSGEDGAYMAEFSFEARLFIGNRSI